MKGRSRHPQVPAPSEPPAPPAQPPAPSHPRRSPRSYNCAPPCVLPHVLLARHWLSARILATGQGWSFRRGCNPANGVIPLPGACVEVAFARGFEPAGPLPRREPLPAARPRGPGPRPKAQATDGPMMTWIFLRGTARGACAFRSITSNLSCFLKKTAFVKPLWFSGALASASRRQHAGSGGVDGGIGCRSRQQRSWRAALPSPNESSPRAITTRWPANSGGW